MIVVSAGMQKAGSGWYFNMINDLLVAGGQQDVRAIREKYHLHPILKYHNCLLSRPVWPKLILLLVPHLFGNTFVVKTHNRPTESLRWLMSRDVVRATYIYRDPRDVVVSAYRHGRKLRKQGQTHSFAKLETLEEAILATQEWLDVWDTWITTDGVLHTRYEDLLADPVVEMLRVADFLSLGVAAREVAKIVASYEPEGKAAPEALEQAGLHFDKGMVGRFRTVMEAEEQALCREYYGDHLERMGYPLE
jgi:hypothetical protein